MTRSPRIAVLNHTAANIHSVAKALERCGADAIVTTDPSELKASDGVVLPGVGAFDIAMRALDKLSLIEPIKDYVESGRPLLGICLGMQLLFDNSDEGNLPGLGLLRGNVTRMSTYNGDLKIPHMGWNLVNFTEPPSARHQIFEQVPQSSYFYFVHSFACKPLEPRDVIATTHHGETICAAVARGPIVATQFHPEKSQTIGLQIYRNFVKYVGRQINFAAHRTS